VIPSAAAKLLLKFKRQLSSTTSELLAPTTIASVVLLPGWYVSGVKPTGIPKSKPATACRTLSIILHWNASRPVTGFAARDGFGHVNRGRPNSISHSTVDSLKGDPRNRCTELTKQSAQQPVRIAPNRADERRLPSTTVQFHTPALLKATERQSYIWDVSRLSFKGDYLVDTFPTLVADSVFGEPIPVENSVYVERLRQAKRVMENLSAEQRVNNFNINLWVITSEHGIVGCIAGLCGQDLWFQEQGLTSETDIHGGRLSIPPEIFFGTEEPFYGSNYRTGGRVTVEDAISALDRAIERISQGAQ
jgi:hypothetical protein